jgi:hypothetical protein
MMLPLLDQTARHYQGEQSYLATVSQLPMFGDRFFGELLRWPAIGNNVRFGYPDDEHQCPLYPHKPTSVEGVGMSALRQKQTFCAAAKEKCRYSITSSALMISDC